MKSVFIAAALSIFALPALAAPVTYLCDVKPTGNAGWVPEEVVVKFDPAKGTAKVLDGIVMHFNGAPTNAKLTDKGSQWRFSWDVLAKDSRGQVATMGYNATLIKKNNRFIISSSPGGNYRGRFSGKGSCKVTKERFRGM